MSLLTITQSISNKSNAGSNAPSVTLPGAITNGAEMLACITAEEGSSDVTITLAGWTLINSINSTGNEVMSVYHKVAGASEPTTITGSLSGTRRWVMWVAELANTDSTLVDISNTSFGTGNAMSSASVATSFPDEHWFAFFAAKTNVNMGTPTNGFVEILESATSNGVSVDVTLGIYDKDVSATGTAQVDVTATASVKWSSIILAVRATPTVVPKSGSDSGSGSTSAVQKAALTLSDSGSGADSATALSNVKIGTDAGSGSESSVLVATMVDTDDGYVPLGGFGEDPFGVAPFGAEGEESALNTVPVVADSGSGAETSLLLAKLSLTESVNVAEDAITQLTVVPKSDSDAGTGTQSLSLAAAFALSDAGAGIESLLNVVRLAGTETGAGSEASTIKSSIAVAEAGSGAESGVLSQLLPLAVDSGTGADAGIEKVTHALSDSGSGVESAIASPKLSLTDSGSGTQSSSLAASMSASDASGDISEAAISPQITFQSDFDTADTFEAFSLATQISAAQSGSGAETANTTTRITASDTGSGNDSSFASYQYALNESGAGSESAVVTVRFAAFDNGDGVEYVQIGTVVSVVDSASGIDVKTLITSLLAQDGATVIESAKLALSAVDSGLGVEVGNPHARFADTDFFNGSEQSDVQRFIHSRFPGNPLGLVMVGAVAKKPKLINSKPPIPTVQEAE
jgi:hypothetical protein